MISGNKKNNVSRLRYTHLLSNALPFNSYKNAFLYNSFYIKPQIALYP